jgi:FeS assembly SUF system regulator
MIRLTRLTDYGIVLLTLFAREGKNPLRNARDLATESRLPLPTVSKILKLLARRSILEARRGVKGGFKLARKPPSITMAEVISAFEGPIGVTECSATSGSCAIERFCCVRSNWMKINRVVVEALGRITLAEMTHPLTLVAPVPERIPHGRHG